MTELPAQLSRDADIHMLPRLSDPAMETSVIELISIAQRVSDIGRRLSTKPPAVEQDVATLALEVATKAVKCRRKRDRVLGGDLFVDPIWNVLLDLYIAQGRAHRVSISSACIAAGVPPTSAIRCCRMMEARGMIVREPDPTDKRRVFLRLTAACRESMTAILLENTRS